MLVLKCAQMRKQIRHITLKCVALTGVKFYKNVTVASSITYRPLKFYTQAKAIIYSKRCQYISALPLFYYVECPRIDISVFKIEFQQQCVPRTLVLKDQVIKARRCPVCVIPYHSLMQVVTVHGFGLQNFNCFTIFVMFFQY